MRIEQKRRGIAVENATVSTALGKARRARRATANLRAAASFAAKNAGVLIGTGAKGSGTRSAGLGIGSASWRYFRRSVENAYTAEIAIRVFSTLITSTQLRRTSQLTESIRWGYVSACGRRNSPTCKFFAPTATGSKRIERIGAHSIFLVCKPKAEQTSFNLEVPA